MDYKNNERRSARISFIIMFIGILAVVLPYIIKADMDDWGFGTAFIGAVVALTAFFVFLMYHNRAKVREKMFRNENILAHFHYSEEFWRQESNNDMKDAGVGKIFGFFFGGIFLVIGIIFFALDPEKNGIMLLIMSGIAFFFFILGFFASGAEKRRIKASLPEAIIAKEGLFFKNTLYTWNKPNFSFLESVTLHPVQADTLLFVLRQMSGGGKLTIVHYHQYFIPVPIPPASEQAVSDILGYFNLPMTEDNLNKMKKEGINEAE